MKHFNLARILVMLLMIPGMLLAAPSPEGQRTPVELSNLLRLFIPDAATNAATGAPASAGLPAWTTGTDTNSPIAWATGKDFRPIPNSPFHRANFSEVRSGSAVITLDGQPSHQQFDYYVHPAEWEINLYSVPAGIRCVTLESWGEPGDDEPNPMGTLSRYAKLLRTHPESGGSFAGHLYRLQFPGKKLGWLVEQWSRGNHMWSCELALFPGEIQRALAERYFNGLLKDDTAVKSGAEAPATPEVKEPLTPPDNLTTNHTMELGRLVDLFILDAARNLQEKAEGLVVYGSWAAGAEQGTPIIWTSKQMFGKLPNTQFHQAVFACARNGWVQVQMQGRPTHQQYESAAHPAIWRVNMWGAMAGPSCIALGTWGRPQDTPNPMSIFGQHAKVMLTHPANGQAFEGKLHHICLPGKDPFWLAEIWRRSEDRWDCELALFPNANGYPLAYRYLAGQLTDAMAGSALTKSSEKKCRSTAAPAAGLQVSL